MEKAMVSCTTEFAQVVVKALSEKYGFDEADALKHLELETVSVTRKTKAPKASKAPKAPKMAVPCMALPFCGVVMDDWCKGIRPNHELFTQCTMAPKKGGVYCATCCGQAEANDTDKPTHGDIRDRKAGGEEWRSPAGKQPVNYGNVMAKRKIDKDAAIAEATAFGWEIPEAQFEVKSRKAGRPKSPSTSDTEDETPKKKRGRPSKKKTLVSGDADDFIGQLVSSVGNASDTSSDGSSSEDESVAPAEETKEAEEVVVAPVEAEEVVVAPVEAEEKPKKAKKAKKPELTDEEKEAKKKAAAEKRKATAAKKKAEKAEAAAKKAAEPVVEAEEVASSDDELASQPDAGEESDDEGEAGVEEIEFEGTTYLKDDDGNVYKNDVANVEEVGKWDKEKKCIVFNKEE
ncbi:hypothetical protein OAA07_00640 [bacterium]|nr:hypothetical protein [bacterium]